MQPKNSKVILCADLESVLRPELLGLEDENLASLGWLTVVSDAKDARECVRLTEAPAEVWVAGSNQMEAVNLAAALKHDRPELEVRLIAFDANGSLVSRAKAAGLNDVLDRTAFMSRYKLAKTFCAADGVKTLGGLDSRKIPSVLAESGKGSGEVPFVEGRRDPGEVVRGPVGAAPAKLGDAVAGIPCVPLMPSGMPLPQVASSDLADASLKDGAALGSVAAKAASSSGGAYVLTVVGAGGGTGKSSIATMCACQARRMGKRTLLLDADLQFGDLAYLTGCDDPLRADDLAESPLRVEGLASAEGMPALLAAPLRLERSEFVASSFKGLMGLLSPRFDVIVVNTGSFWSDVHMQLFGMSSNTLFLLDQRPSSIRACKHALELCASCGIASQPFLFAMNRCSRKALFSGADASSALQGVRVFEFLDGGIAVEEQLGCGNPMALFDSKNALAQSVEAFMDEAMPRSRESVEPFFPPEPRQRRWGFRKRGRR